MLEASLSRPSENVRWKIWINPQLSSSSEPQNLELIVTIETLDIKAKENPSSAVFCIFLSFFLQTDFCYAE